MAAYFDSSLMLAGMFEQKGAEDWIALWDSTENADLVSPKQMIELELDLTN